MTLMADTLRHLLQEIKANNPFADALLKIEDDDRREKVIRIIGDVLGKIDRQRTRGAAGGRAGKGIKRPSSADNLAKARAARAAKAAQRKAGQPGQVP